MLGYKMNLRKRNSVKQGYDFIFLAELAFLLIIKRIFLPWLFDLWGKEERKKW